MLLRGMRRRCPRCGAGGLFRGYFEMKKNCPRCQCRFEARPEDGLFLGAFTINLGVTTGILLLGLYAYIVSLAVTGGEGGPLWPMVAAAAVVAVVLPIVFYPFAKTIWAAIDLALHSIEDDSLGLEELEDPLRGAGHDGPVAPDGDGPLDKDGMGSQGVEESLPARAGQPELAVERLPGAGDGPGIVGAEKA